MFCIHCGAPNPGDASFCSTCGKAIGAPVDSLTKATQPIIGAEKSSEHATGQTLPSMMLPAQSAPQPGYLAAAAGKGKPIQWILAGFAACLLILITVALGSRLNQSSSASRPSPNNAVSDPPPTASPATYTPPPTAPPTDNMSEPTSAPVQAAPPSSPAVPQNPIVGDWRAITIIGSSIGLHLGADGRYVLNPGSDEGIYVFSSGDGTLRLQSNSFFSKGVMIWSCQVSGDSLSCVDPEGAGHVYSRLK
ncbi:MAG TPA: zinc ribbon domain-containing protein [Terriglobales bacterium]|nr:zinc ribbon domain-containing protein [Terriglobales bacterium]